MGEAKQKNKLRNRVLADFPHCIYCGGVTPATTTDHFPPKGMFDKKHRPEGFEFSACGPCNDGARKFESDMVLISRIYSIEETEEHLIKAEEYINGAVKQYGKGYKKPLELIEEMVRDVTVDQKKEIREKYGVNHHAVSIAGPLARKIIHQFAAKMGLAFHYRLVKKKYGEKRPVPLSGVVYPFYMCTNAHLRDKNVFNPMEEIVKLMGIPESLSQGKLDTGDQFLCKGKIVTRDGMVTINRATLRQSLDIYALTCEREEGNEEIQICLDAVKAHKDLIILGDPFSPGFLNKDRSEG